jgi:site-specific DNA recombinase
VLASVTEGIDTSTVMGGMLFELMGVLAKLESKNISVRVKRAEVAMAKAGEPHGGGRPFGYEPGGAIVRESEAAVIQEATRRLLAGEKMGAIVRSLRDREIVGPKGALLTTTMLRQILCNPRIAGIRVHRGEEVWKDGKPVKVAWKPIISEADFRKVRAIFTGRARGGRGVKGPREAGASRAASYAYSGLLKCSLCDGRLFGSSGAYVCACRKTYVTAEPLERVMDKAVITWISGPKGHERFAVLLRARQDGGTTMENLASDRAELADYQVLPERFQTDQTRARAAELAASVRAAEARLAAQPALAVLADTPMVEEELRAAWGRWSIEERRARLHAVLEDVLIKPATRRGGIFDDSRIVPHWR